MCSSICSHRKATWNQIRINYKQIKIKEAFNNIITGIISSRDGSKLVLYWLQGNGIYKRFVHYRVKDINSKKPISLRYIDTIQDSTDTESRHSNIEIENFRK